MKHSIRILVLVPAGLLAGTIAVLLSQTTVSGGDRPEDPVGALIKESAEPILKLEPHLTTPTPEFPPGFHDAIRQGPEKLEFLHAAAMQSFLSRPRFGLSRMMRESDMEQMREDMERLEHLPHLDLWTLHNADAEGYAIKLIGLDEYPEPVRYEIVDDPDEAARGAEIADHRHREGFGGVRYTVRDQTTVRVSPLDEQEQAVLALIEAGQDHVILTGREPGAMLAFGAIRATAEACTDCHGVPRNTLLGAFRYEFPSSLPEADQELQLLSQTDAATPAEPGTWNSPSPKRAPEPQPTVKDPNHSSNLAALMRRLQNLELD